MDTLKELPLTVPQEKPEIRAARDAVVENASAALDAVVLRLKSAVAK